MKKLTLALAAAACLGLAAPAVTSDKAPAPNTQQSVHTAAKSVNSVKPKGGKKAPKKGGGTKKA
jgi:hypothetical protein